jgi:hypothetical protein
MAGVGREGVMQATATETCRVSQSGHVHEKVVLVR